MDERVLRDAFARRNIVLHVCDSRASACAYIGGLIPADATVGFSGSQTLQQLGIVQELIQRGICVYDQNKQGLSREENLRVRRMGAQADYFLASPNAVALTGELVFFSAYGNRTAGVAYAPRVILVAGSNKIVPDYAAALTRGREYATPRNCARLQWDTPCAKQGVCRQEVCYFPEYKRMCGQVLVIEGEVVAQRVQLVLINEPLGY
jgi:hypothetical protein